MKNLKIVVVGTGYVGLVTGTCFAEIGHDVTCVDVDEAKIQRLKSGEIPIYEPGLSDMVRRNAEAGRLSFSTSIKDAMPGAAAVFSAVGTPPDDDGSADLKYVMQVARQFAEFCEPGQVLVTKSTVPVGTAEKVKAEIASELKKRGKDVAFRVASNPEFLKEGTAVDDFMNPERIVVGTADLWAKNVMESVYKPFMDKNVNIVWTDIPSAEMIKYAANSMLAVRISFMNEVANLCSAVGADVESVARGIGCDSRIGPKFLKAGCGYGGSCFPKDVKALVKTGDGCGVRMSVAEAADRSNEEQKKLPLKMLAEIFPDGLVDKKIAVWGLSFKPETDDMREAPSLVVIDALNLLNCTVNACDPEAAAECVRRMGNAAPAIFDDPYECAAGCDAVVLLTEWRMFADIDWEKLKGVMSACNVVDARNLWKPEAVRSHGFAYKSVGRI